jgi:hypothetical protein
MSDKIKPYFKRQDFFKEVIFIPCLVGLQAKQRQYSLLLQSCRQHVWLYMGSLEWWWNNNEH